MKCEDVNELLIPHLGSSLARKKGKPLSFTYPPAHVAERNWKL